MKDNKPTNNNKPTPSNGDGASRQTPEDPFNPTTPTTPTNTQQQDGRSVSAPGSAARYHVINMALLEDQITRAGLYAIKCAENKQLAIAVRRDADRDASATLQRFYSANEFNRALLEEEVERAAQHAISAVENEQFAISTRLEADQEASIALQKFFGAKEALRRERNGELLPMHLQLSRLKPSDYGPPSAFVGGVPAGNVPPTVFEDGSPSARPSQSNRNFPSSLTPELFQATLERRAQKAKAEAESIFKSKKGKARATTPVSQAPLAPFGSGSRAHPYSFSPQSTPSASWGSQVVTLGSSPPVFVSSQPVSTPTPTQISTTSAQSTPSTDVAMEDAPMTATSVQSPPDLDITSTTDGASPSTPIASTSAAPSTPVASTSATPSTPVASTSATPSTPVAGPSTAPTFAAIAAMADDEYASTFDTFSPEVLLELDEHMSRLPNHPICYAGCSCTYVSNPHDVPDRRDVD
ncbi:hypothetical protein CPB83DRAFT_899763 [Crepidotus variabilis]|uniref:Uncharacterized protein n=1 Tax=Crepidotus variabilis TaxID=179855 RepID=A0A9P6JIF2_9AGAR|nr:hypothetical protein CPB83DRAFT_899763 [Crepidotus variabilis]